MAVEPAPGAETVAERLTALRLRHHAPGEAQWTLEELKEHLDQQLAKVVSRPYLGRLFAGTVANPRMDVMQALAQLYGVRFTDLIERRASDIPDDSLVLQWPPGTQASRDDAATLLGHWRELDPQDQRLVLDLAHRLRTRPGAAQA